MTTVLSPHWALSLSLPSTLTQGTYNRARPGPAPISSGLRLGYANDDIHDAFIRELAQTVSHFLSGRVATHCVPSQFVAIIVPNMLLTLQSPDGSCSQIGSAQRRVICRVSLPRRLGLGVCARIVQSMSAKWGPLVLVSAPDGLTNHPGIALGLQVDQ